MSTTETKTVVAETPAPVAVSEAPELAPVVAVEEPKVETAALVEPEVVAPVSETEAIKEELESPKQATTTHAASGTAHTDAEVATKVDGTIAKPEPIVEAEEPVADTKVDEPAPVAAAPAEGSKTVVVEEPKEKKDKSPTKEKAEKAKTESKGFLAKLFGSKEKSPKKPKVKTPKAEKADPLASATFTAPVEETKVEETPATTEAVAESSTSAPVEVTGAAITTDSAVDAPAHAEAPAVPTMDTKPEVPVAKDVEIPVAPAAVAETTETAPVAETSTETKAVETPATKEETPKNIKATRRLSTRFTSFVHKIGGKKDGSTTPPVEKSEAAATAPVSDEAPKLDQPALAEPLKMEETKTPAPPAGAVVSTAA